MSTDPRDPDLPAEDDGASATIEPGKKPYQSPRLTDFGDLQRITATKGSKRGDSTPPGGMTKL